METAIVYTYSRIFVAATEFQDRTPYYCAIVEGGDGSRFPAFIIHVGENDVVEVGKEVIFYSYDENGKPQYSLCGR
jgi:uncharacterized OB-fold protein